MVKFIHNVFEKRELLTAVTKKNIKIRYKQSLLGFLWIFLQPIILTCLFVLIQVFTGINSGDTPYPIFVYAAMMPWSFFSNAVIFSTASIVENSPIIKKIYCPREIFPLASVSASLIDFLAAALIFVVLLWYYRLTVTPYFLFVPLFVLLQFILTTGIALVFSVFAAYKRDIIIGMPFIMQFWLLASPVMYPLSSVPSSWKIFYLANPMAGIIESYRDVLIYSRLPDPLVIASSVLGSAVIFIAGYFIFEKLQKRVADVV